MAKDSAELSDLNSDLRELLAAWFDVGLLELRQITWEAPAALLEKLIAYEAVHKIRSWEDMKNRLDSDRRCFAYFHPNMPHEPLIFVEVALVDGMSRSEEHTSELQSLMRISYAVFCLKKKTKATKTIHTYLTRRTLNQFCNICS